MDEFTRIQTFVKVVETGSFSAAARHESSTSSVARQVKSLEDELGVRLLNRTTRSLSLTEPGRVFYERACALVKDLNNAKLAVSSFQDDVKGLLRVSLRVSTGTTIIVPALPALLEQYPELRIDVSLTDERCDLVAHNIDVAVWIGHIPDSNMIARRLTPSQRIVCGAPAYFRRRGVPQVPADLRRHACIVYNIPTHRHAWTFSKDGQHEEVEVQGALRSDNGLVLLSAAQAGLGLIVVHEWMVRLPIAQGQLVRVLADYAVNPTVGDADLHVVYPSSRGVSRKVRVFVDFLLQLFQGQAAAGAAAAPARQ
ncbi:LysR family transcriptional regulator [Pseudorhodoferax sp.]|uniref:LysR family transcriptional regulator n=1 Tax=Pseudorhodoferax sp. TaxID=1993553 RepID=UPI0039E55B42